VPNTGIISYVNTIKDYETEKCALKLKTNKQNCLKTNYSEKSFAKKKLY